MFIDWLSRNGGGICFLEDNRAPYGYEDKERTKPIKPSSNDNKSGSNSKSNISNIVNNNDPTPLYLPWWQRMRNTKLKDCHTPKELVRQYNHHLNKNSTLHKLINQAETHAAQNELFGKDIEYCIADMLSNINDNHKHEMHKAFRARKDFFDTNVQKKHRRIKNMIDSEQTAEDNAEREALREEIKAKSEHLATGQGINQTQAIQNQQTQYNEHHNEQDERDSEAYWNEQLKAQNKPWMGSVISPAMPWMGSVTDSDASSITTATPMAAYETNIPPKTSEPGQLDEIMCSSDIVKTVSALPDTSSQPGLSSLPDLPNHPVLEQASMDLPPQVQPRRKGHWW